MDTHNILSTGRSLASSAGRKQLITFYVARTLGKVIWRAATPKRLAFATAFLVGGLLLKQVNVGSLTKAMQKATASISNSTKKTVAQATEDAPKKHAAPKVSRAKKPVAKKTAHKTEKA
jgi:hypothetical protein